MTNGATLPEAKELARRSAIKQAMKYTHIAMKERAKALANLLFKSAIAVILRPPGGHPEPSDGTKKIGIQDLKKYNPRGV